MKSTSAKIQTILLNVNCNWCVSGLHHRTPMKSIQNVVFLVHVSVAAVDLLWSSSSSSPSLLPFMFKARSSLSSTYEGLSFLVHTESCLWCGCHRRVQCYYQRHYKYTSDLLLSSERTRTHTHTQTLIEPFFVCF